MTTNDPVTLGEVDRNLQRLREELLSGLANVSSRMDRALDGTVPANVYASDKAAWEYRLKDAETTITEVKLDAEKKLTAFKSELEKKEEITRGQKNLLMMAFIFPLLILVVNTGVNFYFRATGKQ